MNARRFAAAGATAPLGMLLWLTSCAGAATAATLAAPSALRDPPLRQQAPLPYAPGPGRMVPSRAAALRTTPGDARARELSIAFIDALAQGDALGLRAVLADQVALVAEGTQKSRREVSERCLRERASSGYALAPVSRAGLVDAQALLPLSAGSFYANLPLPAGIAPSDRVVPLPAPPDASGSGGRRLSCVGTVYVRGGSDARIVGITR